jgi:tetratricopeptide (TPR) repeat protein
VAILAGAIAAVRRFLRAPAAEWFLVLGLGAVTVVAVIHMTMVAPSVCMIKAFYGLCALVPLCAAAAWGLGTWGKSQPVLRAIVWVLVGLWGLNSIASYWILRDSTQTLMARARSYREQGRHPEAIRLLQGRVESEPKNAELRTLLADSLMRIGKPAEAAKEAAMAVSQAPGEATGHRVLLWALQGLGRNAEAIEQGREVLRLGVQDTETWQNLAIMLSAQKALPDAERVARQGLAIDPMSSELRLALGLSLAGSGRTEEALRELRTAYELSPNNPQPLGIMAEVLMTQQRVSEAIACYARALALDTQQVSFHVGLGRALATKGTFEEATNEFMAALRLAPDFPPALDGLARIKAASPQPEFRDGAEAIRLAERACATGERKVPEFESTLAMAYAEAGRFEDASANAQRARDMAAAASNESVVQLCAKMLALFASHQPYRDAIVAEPKAKP